MESMIAIIMTMIDRSYDQDQDQMIDLDRYILRYNDLKIATLLKLN